MAKLYELAQNYRALIELLDNINDEEASEDDLQMYKDTLESINDSLEGKVENIVKFIKNIESDIAGFKLEEKRLAARRKTLENKADGLKNYMSDMLRLAGKKEVNAGLFKVKFQNNPASVEVLNENDIPEDYREKQPDKILKTPILKALKDGAIIPGVLLVEDKEHLRIS